MNRLELVRSMQKKKGSSSQESMQMPKTQNQPLGQPAPPDVAIKEEKHQGKEVLEEESPEKKQPEETAE